MKLFERPLLALFPRRCAYCGKPVAPERGSCRKCEAELPRIKGDVCLRCGRGSEYCACRGSAAYYDSLIAPFYYGAAFAVGCTLSSSGAIPAEPRLSARRWRTRLSRDTRRSTLI